MPVPTIDGDTAQQIMYDVAAERDEKSSKLKYDAEMREFRAEVEREWSAWRAEHPDAELYVPPELPPAGEPAKGKVAEADTSDKPGDTKDGLPRSSFAYAPDGDPATWKLPYLTADGAPDTAHLAAAAAALSPGGFRGQKVDIPTSAMRSVKAKLRQAYRRAGKSDADMPDQLREAQLDVPGYVLELLAEESMQPVYVIEALLEAHLTEGSGDHFYGAWSGGSAKSGGHPTGGGGGKSGGGSNKREGMTPEEFHSKYPSGSMATHDANGKPLSNPVLGPDGKVYAGPPGRAPYVAKSMDEVAGRSDAAIGAKSTTVKGALSRVSKGDNIDVYVNDGPHGSRSLASGTVVSKTATTVTIKTATGTRTIKHADIGVIHDAESYVAYHEGARRAANKR